MLSLRPVQSRTDFGRVSARKGGLVVQLVRIPACHAGGREFESRPDRKSLSKRWGFFVQEGS